MSEYRLVRDSDKSPQKEIRVTAEKGIAAAAAVVWNLGRLAVSLSSRTRECLEPSQGPDALAGIRAEVRIAAPDESLGSYRDTRGEKRSSFRFDLSPAGLGIVGPKRGPSHGEIFALRIAGVVNAAATGKVFVVPTVSWRIV
jgi:hypothetical protein